MKAESEASTSSDDNPLSPPEPASDLISPSPFLNNFVIIKRTAPEQKIISFRRIIDNEVAFHDPVSATDKNDDVRKKYTENKRKTKDSFTDALKHVFDTVPIPNLQEVLNCEKTEEILSFLFVVSSYVIENYFGKPGPNSAKPCALYLYIHNTFRLDEKKETENFKLAKKIEPPEFFIKLFILEANGLKPLSETTHLCCKVWLNDKMKSTEMTSLVKECSHPVWNIRFLFFVTDLKTDVITIEMTGIDISKNLSCKKKGLKEKLFKKPSDDSTEYSIGKVKVKVNDIYSEGIDEWVALECSKDEFEDVFLHIRAKFGVAAPETNSSNINRHMLLIKCYVEKSMKPEYDEDGLNIQWEQVLNKCLLTLTFLHSVISCLTEYEDSLCRFIVLTHLGLKLESISYEFFYYLLLHTTERAKLNSVNFTDQNLHSMYEKEVTNLYNLCLTYISSLHSHNFVGCKQSLSECEFALRAIYLSQDIIKIAGAPLMMLKSESVDWMERKNTNIMELMPKIRTLRIISFIDYTIQFQKVFDEMFRKINLRETYTELTHISIQEVLTETLRTHISEISTLMLDEEEPIEEREKLIKEAIELYSKVNHLIAYISETVNIPISNLKLSSYLELLDKSVILKCFQYQTLKVESEIKKAVEFDNLQTLDISYSLSKCYKESSSARITRQSVEKLLKKLWLTFSLVRKCRNCDENFAISLQSCCFKYSDLLNELISTRKLFENFYSEGRTSLCVLANNFWFIAVYVGQVSLETIETIPRNLPNCKSKLEDSCHEICSQLTDRYLENITELLTGILKDTAIDSDLKEYTKYIEKIVWKETFIDASFDIFKIFLRFMSERIISLLQKFAEEEKDSPTEKEFFSLLKRIITKTKEICNISDDPEENELIWDVNYSDFLSYLESRIV